MPSLSKALKEAVLKGAKGAKVMRPAEKELIRREAEKAAQATAADELATKLEKGPEPIAKEAPAAPETQAVPEAQAAPEAQATPEVPVAPEAPLPVPGVVDPPAPKKVQEAFQKAMPEVETARLAESAPAIAKRMSSLKLDDYDLQSIEQINFDVINDGNDIKAVIADLAKANEAKVKEAIGPAETVANLQAVANAFGLSKKTVEAAVLREAGGIPLIEGLTASQTMGALRKFTVNSADQLKQLADKIAAEQALPIEQVQFARQVQIHNTVYNALRGGQAEWGRMGVALGMPVGKGDYAAKQITDLITMGGGDIKRMAKMISQVDTAAGITKIVDGGLFKRTHKAVQSLIVRSYINGILSGPRTLEKNILSGVVFPLTTSAEMAVASRIGTLLGTKDGVMVGEAMANLHGILGGLPDAMRLTAKAFKQGQTIDHVMRYGNMERNTIDYLPELDMPILGSVVRGVDAVINFPTQRILGPQDEFVKTVVYRGYTEREAMRHVAGLVESGQVKTADEAADAARQFMENPPQNVDDAAEAWAAQMTMQSPLGPIGESVQKVFHNLPYGALIASFIRATTNLMKQGLSRSGPLSLFTARFWRDVEAGGVARDMALARMAISTPFVLWVANEVASDRMTGTGPTNPDAAAMWAATGKKPYHRLNERTGKWESYQAVEPYSTAAGTIANIVELTAFADDGPESLKDNDEAMWEIAGLVIASVFQNTVDKTSMQSMADFMEFAQDPIHEAGPYIKKKVASTVPYSAVTRTVRELDDPYLREATTLLSMIQNNTPGYSKDLPLKPDIFGEPRMKNRGSLAGTMSIFPESSKVYHDKVIDEAEALYKATHKVAITRPKRIVDGMRLNDKEYTEYFTRSRTAKVFVSEHDRPMTFKEKLEEVMGTEGYQKAAKQDRVEIIKAIQSKADEASRKSMEGDPAYRHVGLPDYDYADRITAFRQKRERIKLEQ